jgi:hypothetical protein
MKETSDSRGSLTKTKKRLVPVVQIVRTLQTPEYLEKRRKNTLFAVEIPFGGERRATMEVASVPYEVLDLALDGVGTTELCRSTMKLLANAKRVIAVAGAGISVAAGIPDFRSSTGLFSTLKADTKFKPSGKQLFDASVYKVPAQYSINTRAKREHNHIMK